MYLLEKREKKETSAGNEKVRARKSWCDVRTIAFWH